MPNKKLPGNIVEGVYEGVFTRRKLPERYYNYVAEDLLAAIGKGVGGADDFAALSIALGENAQMFAGAKTYQMVSELEDLKVGKLPFSEFAIKGQAIVTKYENWLDAEVNTAQQQTLQARQWKIIEADSDLFTVLRYSTIGDACRICKPLDGITAGVNSPIWAKIYPCNHYNCYCIVTQHVTGSVDLTKASELDRIVEASTGIMAPVFLSNPGITEQIFTNKHPYFAEVPKEDRSFAKKNFNLPIK